MAPHTTETTILQSYLLPPASLPNILSFTQFLQLFPTTSRGHPHIKTLYRDLQFLRSVDTDIIRENIDSEARKSNDHRRDLLRGLQAERRVTASQPRKRKRDDEATSFENASGVGADVSIDSRLFGPLGMVPKTDRYHYVDSLFVEMEAACEVLQTESIVSQQEADTLLATMQETVGSLSDLRYGKFAKVAGLEADGELERSVMESLKTLGEACVRPSR